MASSKNDENTYLAVMATELAEIAKRQDHSTLAFIFEMAALEAQKADTTTRDPSSLI